MQKWSILIQWGFLGGTVVRNLPASARDTKDGGPILDWEDLLEKEVATHSSILVWKIYGQRGLAG